MDVPTRELYETMSVRALERIPRAVGKFRAAHSSSELFTAICRWAVAYYSTEEHSKHAFLACHSAHRLRESLGERFDDLLVECALYAADSRLPWSEPPVMEPPSIERDQPFDLGEIRDAVAAEDRPRGERWLARAIYEPDFAPRFLTVAADDFGDLGHNLIVATAAWELAEVFPEEGRFPLLRAATWEWMAHREGTYVEKEHALDTETLFDRWLDVLVCDGGSPIAFHALALLDAAIRASAIANDRSILLRVRDFLSNTLMTAPARALQPGDGREESPPIYRLSLDYGEYLKACAIRRDLAPLFPTMEIDSLQRAARANLEQAPVGGA
ncbi:MAG TPA: hypothetical protein VMT00_09630 [Thermoanaerobaculia bacterium]|nr:hypothetical protein [Thermoanaerobaculia bacterium]